jgi:membrane peptidoglycan carboxypeptidase
MRAVVQGGTGKNAALPDGRPVAGKTGTTDKSVAAWFVGYVPQLSTAVTMFNQKNQPIPLIPGYSKGIYGGTIPAKVWRSYMTRVTQGMEVKQFTQPTFSEGTQQMWDTPTATPTPTPTPSGPATCPPDQAGQPGCQQTQQPSASPQDPVGGGQPCSQWGLPPGCDPNSPPSTPPPAWWCNQHQDDPRCRPQGDPGTGGTGGTGGNGTPQTRPQSRARVKD